MGRADKKSGGDGPTCGILAIDKPVGMTSMDVVAIVRGKAGGTKTGHAGTLDPRASGVLLLALGKATRQLKWFMAADKRYVTEIDLSCFTTTDDAEGDRIAVEPQPAPPTESEISQTIETFVGRIMQRPPAHSAVKIGGRRAYELARRGIDVQIEPRGVVVHTIQLTRYRWPLLELDIRCGKGTYIRSLARDIGCALGTGGYCHTLRRTAVGPFTLASCRRLEELPETLTAEDLMELAEALAMLDQADSG